MYEEKRLILAIGGVTFALSTAFALSGCGLLEGLFGPGKWDVSKDSSSSVTAELIKESKDKYRLKISGKGKMKDFASASETPWKDKAAQIDGVEIDKGITSIGSYAFGGIDVEGIILPESVVSVGNHVVSGDVGFYVYTQEIDFAEEDLERVCLYRDTMPETHDRYWQSDKSKGDIIADGETFDSDGQYWHFDGKRAEKWETIRILFVGNSFTYRNGVLEYSSGVPGIFDCVAEDLGYCVETYSVTGPGWYLSNHAKATDTCGKQIDKLLHARSDFDYVVLQEQSVNPFENYASFLSGVKAMQAKIQETQDHARIYLYETWGSPFSANERKITVPEMEGKLLKAYNDAAKECGLDVSYVGQAFTHIYNTEPSIYLYDTDHRHQGYTGAYLSACVHVGTILGGDVRDTLFEGEEKYSAPELSEETLTALREAAYGVAFGEIVYGTPDAPDAPDVPKNPGEEGEYSLEIAVWGRWITEAQFVKLYNGFLADAQGKGIDVSKAHYTYYMGATTSDPYYYIANFTGKTVADGGADVIFPCATNLTTQSGTAITKAEITPLGITLNGKTDRCVANLTETELATAFCNYCLSDAGKEILSKA